MLCGYLNINSLRKKIHDLRLIILDIPIVEVSIVERSCGEKPTSGAKQSLLTSNIKIV